MMEGLMIKIKQMKNKELFKKKIRTLTYKKGN